MTIPLESVGERMTEMTDDSLKQGCQQIVRQMPDHLPKVNAFRNSAHTDGLGDFCCWGIFRVSLRKLLYASGGPAVQRI